MRAMEIITSHTKKEDIEQETVGKVIRGLKSKKAKDVSLWRNEYVKGGGKEMISSISKIVSIIDSYQTIPTEWNKMKIKSIHKKGPKNKMTNRRGLFITNIIS